MSYTFTRSVEFKTIANMAQAIPTCLALVEYIRTNRKLETHLMAPVVGGHPNQVLFVLTGESLDQMQLSFETSMKDPAYLALLGQLKDHIVGSSTRDQAWKTLA